MTEVKDEILEVDAVIIPLKFDKIIEESDLVKEETNLSESKEQSSLARRTVLFGRLKKSLRKKSAAIL